MLLSIPDVDRTQFQELGDGSILMPPVMMEKYLYPALYLMQYLPGGIGMMIVYSFFLHGSAMPRNRTNHDLEALKSTTLSAGNDIPAQGGYKKPPSSPTTITSRTWIRKSSR
jgi:hypothetical protein